jgi:hypothetical protein
MEQIIKNIHSDLIELSSIELQKSYWLGNDPEYISSYVELMCRLFDDSSFENFISNGEKFGLNKHQINLLSELSDSLNSYKERVTDQEIIADPEWNKISEKAKLVLTKIDFEHLQNEF